MANLQKIWVHSLIITLGVFATGFSQNTGGDDWGGWFEDTDTAPAVSDTSGSDGAWDDWSGGEADLPQTDTLSVNADEFSDWGIETSEWGLEPEPEEESLPTQAIYDPNAPVGMGMAIEISAVSPFWVSRNMKTWYSFMDWRVGVQMPFSFQLPLYGMRVTASAEIASFNFENTFPQGGQFGGISVLAYGRLLYQQFCVDAGFGLFGNTGGALFGAMYRYPISPNIYLGAGGRAIWVNKIEPLGSSSWADVQFLAGYKF
ncbi:MAG: hypothetical protein K9N22_09910 [Candidatus Marinimicrobia bacterium]|nr:hypothetical protein [Candidatus Neomarinimicrobiota bacterium]MCF7841077.1 hypothetical protein [Candidatus Neomarinimicrobiota bacterium]